MALFTYFLYIRDARLGKLRGRQIQARLQVPIVLKKVIIVIYFIFDTALAEFLLQARRNGSEYDVRIFSRYSV